MRDLPLTKTVKLSIELTENDNIWVEVDRDCVPPGWVRLGEMTVEVPVPQVSAQQIADARISDLKTVLTRADAEHENKRNLILEQISKLQALPAPEATSGDEDDFPF